MHRRYRIKSIANRHMCTVLAAGLAVAHGSVAFADDEDLDALFGAATETSAKQGNAAPTPAPSQVNTATPAVIRIQPEQLPTVSASPTPKPAIIDEIVVTARKRAETIQQVPLSVTPFTGDQLEQRGMSGLEDVAASTPGFTFEGFITGGAHGNAVIRGLAQQFTTSRIQNVSFFLDGVYLQRQSMLNLGMIDMERVEVVKGPQNALYGRNAFAGAVNYITLRPGAETEGYLLAGTGDNKREDYRLSISGPIGDGQTLFGKFTAGFSRYDGHTENNHPVANADPPGPNMKGMLGGYDDKTFSVSLAYEPSESLRMRTSFYDSDLLHETAAGYSISGVGAARFGLRFDDQNDLNCNQATVNNIGDPSKTHTGFTAYCGELPSYASDIAERTVDGIVIDPRGIGSIARTRAVTFSLDYELLEDLSLHYLYGQARHNSHTNGGASDEDPLAGRGIVTNAAISAIDTQRPEAYSFVNTSGSRPDSWLKSYSHELRFDWEFNPQLRLSSGLYYSEVEDQEWTTLFISDVCNASSQDNIDNCNEHLSTPNSLPEETVLTAGVAWDQFTRQHGGVLRGEWTQFNDAIAAVFASASYNFTPSLEATLEARYTQEDKKVRRFTDGFMLAPGETVTYNPPQHPVIPGLGNSLTSSIAVPYDDAVFRYFTPRAILNWDWSDRNMLYISAAKGVKSGGFNNADDPSELTYDEAENWTYELGSKNSLFNRAITLNGAVFYIDWDGLQGGVPPSIAGLNTSDIIANVGGADSLGIELESNIRLGLGFSLDLGLTYNDAKYKDGTKYSAGHQETGRFHCDGVTCPADGDVSGNQLARTSRDQYSLGINFATDVYGWALNTRLDTNYQSKQYVTPLNLAWVPERLISNASFALASPSETWEIKGWVKNLTDEDYPANAFFIGVFNQYMAGKGPRRTMGLNLKYKF